MAGDLEYYGVPPQEMRDVETRPEFIAAAGQNTFAVTYKVGYIDVYRNGILQPITEFTAANGTSVTLVTPCEAGEHIRFRANRQVAMSDAYTRSEANNLNNEFYAIATGTSDVATCITDPSVGFVLRDGREVKVRWLATNTTATPTIDVNGTGAKTIVGPGGAPIPIGAIVAGQELTIRYSVASDKYEVVSPLSNVSPVFTGNPTAPTPAQFDNDTSIATTAFVKSSGLRAAGIASVSSTQTLASFHVGQFCYAAAGSPISLTLPTAASVPSGEKIFIQNVGQTVTVQRNGTDSLNAHGGVLNSVSFGSGEWLECTSNGTNTWWVNGSSTLSLASSFYALKTTNGYQKLPSGLIIQWGSLSYSTNTAVTVGQFSLPIAFPNAFLNGLCQATDVSASGAGARAQADLGTTTTFVFNHSAYASFTTTLRWIAIGH